MNREAAALRVPVYSIFRGKIGAVDRYLAASGRLVLIERAEDVASKIVIRRRALEPELQKRCSTALTSIVDNIEAVLLVEL
jgi:hypothetical protein